MDIFKENIDISGNGNVVQIGNENINLSTNKSIVIGHVTYHGDSAEVIRHIVKEVIDEGRVSFKPIFLLYWLIIDTVLGGLITCYIALSGNLLAFVRSICCFCKTSIFRLDLILSASQ